MALLLVVKVAGTTATAALRVVRAGTTAMAPPLVVKVAGTTATAAPRVVTAGTTAMALLLAAKVAGTAEMVLLLVVKAVVTSVMAPPRVARVATGIVRAPTRNVGEPDANVPRRRRTSVRGSMSRRSRTTSPLVISTARLAMS
jgi:hypothetical protein